MSNLHLVKFNGLAEDTVPPSEEVVDYSEGKRNKKDPDDTAEDLSDALMEEVARRLGDIFDAAGASNALNQLSERSQHDVSRRVAELTAFIVHRVRCVKPEGM